MHQVMVSQRAALKGREMVDRRVMHWALKMGWAPQMDWAVLMVTVAERGRAERMETPLE
jgi:hypothetical protein